MSDLARTVEALLFLSAEPVTEAELLAACECEEEALAEALVELGEAFVPGARGLELRELAGGWTLATAADTEPAARRLLSKPRTPPLSPAQAETLAIVAYLQPVSRPEITRIRGVSADSAAGTLLERGLIEESGRSPFGAVLYRTTQLFLKLFGMVSLDDLPDVEEWDPSPEEEADLRDRLLRAGEARAGATPATEGGPEEAGEGDGASVGEGDGMAEAPAELPAWGEGDGEAPAAGGEVPGVVVGAGDDDVAMGGEVAARDDEAATGGEVATEGIERVTDDGGPDEDDTPEGEDSTIGEHELGEGLQGEDGSAAGDAWPPAAPPPE